MDISLEIIEEIAFFLKQEGIEKKEIHVKKVFTS